MEKSELILEPVINIANTYYSSFIFPNECLNRNIIIYSLKIHVSDINISISFNGRNKKNGSEVSIFLYPFVMNKLNYNILQKGPIDLFIDNKSSSIKIYTTQADSIIDCRCEMLWSTIDYSSLSNKKYIDLYMQRIHFTETTLSEYIGLLNDDKKLFLYSTSPLEKNNISFLIEHFKDSGFEYEIDDIIEYKMDELPYEGFNIQWISYNMLILHYDYEKQKDNTSFSLKINGNGINFQLYFMFI